MKTLVLATMLFASCVLSFAQGGYVSAGYVYNAREDDHGAFVETGFEIHRFGAAVNFNKMVTDPYRFHEVELLVRYRFVHNMWAEAGWAPGAACFTPQIEHSCELHGTVRTRTPIVGLQWLAPTQSRFQPVVRMDFVRWQLPPTKYKDDGFRMFFGVRWPRHEEGAE